MPSQPENQRADRRFTGASHDPAIEAQLDQILQRLYSFYHVEIDMKLDRTFRFLSKINNPHLTLPKVVHIAGTNGKGSTAATLRALLEASGHTVHVYTSPHLVHPTERIRLAGELISSEALIALLEECLKINGSDPITFFEFFTCAAFLAFARTPADYLILETGMGGRLDTTNIVSDPAACIVTTISYDHVKFLGNTLPLIAREKAGIMKAGVPCVIGKQMPEALEAGIMDVFQQQSQSLSPAAKLLRFGAEWSSEPSGDRMMFRYGADSFALPRPSLPGNHQIWNAGAALAAFKGIAPSHFKAEILSTALGQIYWPGRLQILKRHAYNKLLPPEWDIVIDGGHNDSAGIILAQQLEEWAAVDAKPLHLIAAMVNRKDPAAFLAPLRPYAASITLTEIEGEATSFKKEELAQIAKDLGFTQISTAPTPFESVQAVADRHSAPEGRILIAGSLFLMGNILHPRFF